MVKGKERKERKIFQLFAEAASLLVIPNSVKNEQPPAPDVLCKINGGGHVAFELVEIVTPALMREMENGQKLRKALKAACNTYPEIQDRFHDAMIHVGFLDGVTIRKRLSIVNPLVDLFRQHAQIDEGDIQVPNNLKKIVREISVARGVSRGPAFDVSEMVKCTDDVLGRIKKKCEKRYESNHLIELLAYYTSHSDLDDFEWQSEFHDRVVKILAGSPFKRVWVYDCCENTIKYVHPA